MSDRCEACGQKMPVRYERKLPGIDIRTLIELYRQTRMTGELWHHIGKIHRGSKSGGGDFSKLRHPVWGLIAQAPHEIGEKSSSGLWRITRHGERWLEGEVLIPSHAVFGPEGTFLGRGHRARFVSPKDLNGSKFDFEELMGSARLLHDWRGPGEQGGLF